VSRRWFSPDLDSYRRFRRIGFVCLALYLFGRIGFDLWTGEISTMLAVSRAAGVAAGVVLIALILYIFRRLFGARRSGDADREKLQ